MSIPFFVHIVVISVKLVVFGLDVLGGILVVVVVGDEILSLKRQVPFFHQMHLLSVHSKVSH